LLGYTRESIDDTRLQREALTRGDCERIYEEKASGAKANRPALTKLFAMPTREMWSSSGGWTGWLVRSLMQLITTSTLLCDRGVESVHSLSGLYYITQR
jgi:hypothetical protein